jgi:GNAT superfamily N-acetyltransferase
VANHLPTPERTADLIGLGQRRIRYLRSTDPGGSWVAEEGTRIIGIAQAHIRGAIWTLATLGVLPGFQDKGIGHALLSQVLEYGNPASPGAIFSSPDPRAVRRYVSAGFDLHPTAVAYGPVRKAVDMQAGVRKGSLDDLRCVNDIDRAVRGADRRGDVEFQLSIGYQLLVDDVGGYAIIRGGRLAMLSALDEGIATRLLLSAIAQCPPGAPVDVSWITAEQQWAVRAVAVAGVPIRIHEGIMMRNGWQPRLPYLANGIFG